MAIKGVEYRSDYLDDTESRLSYNALIEAEWKFSLDDWEKLYLSGAYRPYSAFLDGRAIANICLADVVLTCSGKSTQAHQLGGVVVAPEYRGRGLARELFERVFDDMTQEALYFLYAHNRVYEFYELFGFKAVAESQYTIKAGHQEHVDNTSTVQKLDVWSGQDREFLQERVLDRAPISDLIAVNGQFPLYLYNILFNDDICAIRDHIYFVEPLDAVVSCCQGEGRFKLIDVISSQMPSVSEVLKYFPTKADLIEFRFTPDKMGVETNDRHHIKGPGWLLNRARLYVRGVFPLDIGVYPRPGEVFFYPDMYLF